MPRALNVDRDAVKTLALAVGIREAARQMGIAQSTVQTWSEEGKWLQPIPQKPSKAVRPVPTKASDAMRNALETLGSETRVGFAKAAKKVAKYTSNMQPEKLLERDTAQSSRSWASVASTVHGWEKQNANDSSSLNLNVLSGRGGRVLIAVDSDTPPAEKQIDATPVD